VCKLVGSIAFVAAVVATPRHQWWAFAVDGVVIGSVAAFVRLPWRRVARRLVIEVPFLAFAAAMPFVGGAPKVHVAGLRLSEPGLWAAWGIVAKGTLGVLTMVVLASTTPAVELIGALERLHVPRTLTSIAAFMIRYANVLGDELQRMHIARVSRGARERWVWHAAAVASTAGALFVRAYERGERVYMAMASRGFAGAMPRLDADARRQRWLVSLSPAALAGITAALAWIAA
jgi:cobalt/nickel transport system permease protein